MNLLGKIFVMLIFAMSLVFMAFALMTYSAHRNWYQAVTDPTTGLRARLNQANQQSNQLQEQIEKLQADITSEQTARREAVAALETERQALIQQRDQLAQEQAQLVEDQRVAVASMQATQETLAGMRTELGTLRESVRKVEQEKEQAFAEVVKLSDELFQAQGELRRVNQRNQQLAQDVARQKQVLERNGLTGFESLDGLPPQVDGVILASSGNDLVEISLGSDDGLVQGHRLDVYRSDRYLGRIEVIRTAPDKAVAKIIPEFRKGKIEKEDRVATRLR